MKASGIDFDPHTIVDLKELGLRTACLLAVKQLEAGVVSGEVDRGGRPLDKVQRTTG